MKYGRWRRRYVVALPDGSHLAECDQHEEAIHIARRNVGSRIEEWYWQDRIPANAPDPNRLPVAG